MTDSHWQLGPWLDALAQRFDQADLFFGHGTGDPWDEAVYLTFAALGISFDEDDSVMERWLQSQEVARVEALARRRIEERIPVAYLVGEAWFCGLPFKVDERVLIPRSPIAELINNRFEPLLAAEPQRILDLCTGSGCIGIACALAFEDARVDLSDISRDALQLARENVLRHGLQERVRVLESDLLRSVQGPYDLIVSNPPYVSRQEIDELPAEYHHEPELGLLSQDDGLDIPLRILREAAAHLSEDGLLVLEVGYSRAALTDRLPGVPLLWLEFEQGGEGVCALTAQQLRQYF